jgi:flagellin-like protein
LRVKNGGKDEKMRAFFRNKNSKAARSQRAVSPVIATVILVAIAITVSVAVAYWMGGIAGSFTQFEKVEIQSAVCTWDTTNEQWDVQIKLKNTGTATCTLIGVFVNEIEVDNYDLAIAGTNLTSTDWMTVSLTVESGATATMGVYIDDGWGAPITPGTTVNIKIHSAGGMDYIKLITLV